MQDPPSTASYYGVKQSALKFIFHTLHCDGANRTRGLLDRTYSRAADGVIFLYSIWNFHKIIDVTAVLHH